MASGVYLPSYEDLMEAVLTSPWDREDNKAALYNASKVAAVNYNADTTYSTTNEIVGSGYTAGGLVVTGTAWTRPGAGVAKWSFNALQWPGSTLTGVRFIDVYADQLANELMCGIDLVDPVNTSDGTLLVTPQSTGVLTYDLTP
jgi:hypothetical protein